MRIIESIRFLCGALLLGVATVSLTGCPVAVVGGAAAGGYYVGQQSERSLGEVADDAAITAAVNAKYVADGLVKAIDINVDTHKGVVILRGKVASREAHKRAVSLAEQVNGVEQVVSQLEIKSK